jgi:acetyl-CoA acetyltransferase
MRDAYITGIGTTPLSTYTLPERELVVPVVREALTEAGLGFEYVDGVYAPNPPDWTPQKFFVTSLTNWLGLSLDRSMEIYTGGSSGGVTLQTAVEAVRDRTIDVAIVLAVERLSIMDIEDYFSHTLKIFDTEFHSPAGPTILSMYAQSLQRYLHEYDVSHEEVASICVKNRENAVLNPEALFEDPMTVEEVLGSEVVADPLRLYESPAMCDGAAAVVVTTAHVARHADSDPVEVAGIGYHHAPSHFTGVRDGDLTRFPAVAPAVEAALDDAERQRDDLDVVEPYAPFPHVEAIITEELGYFQRGEGAAACARGETAPDGRIPVSPSGGCLGRGHPALVTPVFNCIDGARQLRGTATNQVSGAEVALATSEHGHVDGVNAMVLSEDRL